MFMTKEKIPITPSDHSEQRSKQKFQLMGDNWVLDCWRCDKLGHEEANILATCLSNQI